MNHTQYLCPSVPMLIPHLDGSIEKIEVREMRPHGDRWMVAQEQESWRSITWLLPQPPRRDFETGYLVATCEVKEEIVQPE